jgi:hypothetical protein
MALVWLVECKHVVSATLAVLPREPLQGKSTDALVPNPNVGSFECPHCHEPILYGTDDFIPGVFRWRNFAASAIIPINEGLRVQNAYPTKAVSGGTGARRDASIQRCLAI